MEYMLELLKIVEGALTLDRQKVVGFTRLLATKLESDGNGEAAKRLERALSSSKARKLTASRFAGLPTPPVDQESRAPLGSELTLEKDRVPLFISSEVSETVDEYLQFYRGADRLLKKGLGISPSLLLYGPPGCGKSQLAAYIASEIQRPLLTARIDGLISSYLGRTAKNLRSLFEYADSHPCVLFLDELDSLGKMRDDQRELGELKRIVVTLLQCMDTLDSRTVIIGATNHDHLLDPAIWRRFAFKAKLAPPEIEARRAMFAHYLGEYGTARLCEMLARLSDGLSGWEIRQVSEDSVRKAILADDTQVDEAGILRRILVYKHPDLDLGSENPRSTIKALRELDSSVFTYRRLSELFHVSTGFISNLMKE